MCVSGILKRQTSEDSSLTLEVINISDLHLYDVSHDGTSSSGLSKSISFSETVESHVISDDEQIAEELGDSSRMPSPLPPLDNHQQVVVTWLDCSGTPTSAGYSSSRGLTAQVYPLVLVTRRHVA